MLISILFFSSLVSLPFCSLLFAGQAKPDIDEADNRVAADFERVKACLADHQWDEAVEILRRVMEDSGDRLWPVTRWRYITVRDYCHLQLAGLPPEALALYRGRADPPAEIWYREGIAQRDRAKLLLVARRAFAGSFGDDALLALGEMALERADYAAARGYWEKILPIGASSTDKAATWLSYPDTDISPAAVRARLVLTSILEGSLSEGSLSESSRERARRELARFKRLHPDAVGRFGGRVTNYARALERLLDQSERWPPPEASPDWPTFAGTQWREKIATLSTGTGRIEAAAPAWRIRLRDKTPADGSPADESLLNFHPTVVGNMVFVATGEAILGLDLRTGRPAWGQAGAAIFRDELGGGAVQKTGRTVLGLPEVMPRDPSAVPQHTLTVEGGRLFCRMDSPTVVRPGQTRAAGGGYLVCLDLEGEGRLIWRIEPENNDWAFEGTPVCDGPNVYAAMRLLGIRPQAYVACFDAQTGQRRWRRFICGAEAGARAARAVQNNVSRRLLTLSGERIYYNTGLGAVAALSVPDGQLEWISTYPRERRTERSPSKPPRGLRDPNPCLYHGGVLYVAPSDSRRILALDAVTGQILWQSGSQVEEARHLLGVAGDKLIASGKRLYWIETGRETGGKLKHVWPRTNRGPGFGRGILAGQCVYLPAREKIFVFEQRSARLVDSIELGPKNAAGGNLIVVQGRLLIATPEELIVFARAARANTKPKRKRAM